VTVSIGTGIKTIAKTWHWLQSKQKCETSADSM